MPLHIMTKQLCMWTDDNIAHANMLFYPLYYDLISLITQSIKITQAFHLLLGLAENQIVFCVLKFKIAFG